jgi:hypothetical protein
MAMFCPKCSTSFEQRIQCPTCDVRLMVLDTGRSRGLFARGWQHTPAGRVVVGLMIAQGLFYGLRHFLTGILLLTVGHDWLPEVLASLPGLVTVQVLQVTALLLGGLLVGAGQRGGLVLGLLLGMLNGTVAVIAQQWPATATQTFIPTYGQPVIQGAVGAVGGWLGCTIWRPLVTLLGPSSAQVKRVAVAAPTVSPFAGRIHWLRILLGAAFAVAGCLSATYLLERVAMVSNEALVTDGYWQEKVVTWEIKALAMLLGGALAGACTTNGAKQGVFVGIFSGLALTGATATRGPTLQIIGLTMVYSLSLALVGGWFGGQLFPPVSPFKRLRGMGPASLS